MKLIVLYGPPAVGKLTVGKALAEKTGYGLFHNHLSADLVRSLFSFGTPEFTDLNEEIKLRIIEEAAKSNRDLIITLVYGVETLGGTREDDFVRNIIEKVEKHEGEVVFVKLTCSKEEQKKRLVDESRTMYRKLTDLKRLEEIEKEVKMDEEIPFVKSLVLDTTDLSPEQTADEIIKYLENGNNQEG